MTIEHLVSSLSSLAVKFDTIGNRILARECMELANNLVDDVFSPRDDVMFIYDPLNQDPLISTGNFIVYRTGNKDEPIFIFVSEYIKKVMAENHLSLT